MSVAQDGCIFIQGGLSVELTDKGCEVWITNESYTRHRASCFQSLTPDDMEDLAAELTKWALVQRARITGTSSR